MEEYAYILDIIPYGDKKTGETLVKLVGERFFTLFNAVLKKDVNVKIGERVYVGKELSKRDKIYKIRGKIEIDALTTIARQNLYNIIKDIIKHREKDFIAFINNAKPINMRMHQLDLIPGIGKKNMKSLLEERAKKPFESFEDLKKRVPSWLDPISSFANKIINEMEGKEKHYFFTSPQRLKHFRY